MSDLQTAYYIIAIVFMSVIFLILLGVLAAVLVIRAKVNAIHARVEEKIEQVTGLAEKGSAVIGSLKKVVDKTKR
jgi:hypothetical protein